MKVSSIIKTPVKATQFNGGTASVRAENGSGVIVASTMTHEFGHAIAHAINSHDALVDMVERLKTSLTKAISMLDDPGLGCENEA